MGHRVCVHRVIFAERIEPASVAADVQRADPEVPPLAVAAREGGGGKCGRRTAGALERADVPELDGGV
ncbi:hypothetical protein V496_10214 [Pseudogymnoascus sp. VKM F-4515 (FW-2607)]|nr:hypothetical protein V496_10214 [Pseudogymnoascus sp. VKM F-4515 (FW-2607)]